MKKFITLFALSISLFTAKAQTAEELHSSARDLMRQGDYGNATLLLVKALEQSPNDLEIAKDLSLNYYFDKNNDKALETIKPLLDRTDVDDQVYQVAGTVYKAMENYKDGEALYKKGIKRFPKSGPLYNEYGELLMMQQNPASIVQWERGIEMDPTYPGNYYNASKYYSFTADKVWSLLYAEIFVNLEPLSNRTAEIKTLLLEGYKKLVTDADQLKNTDQKNKFETAVLQSMSRQVATITGPVTPESLSMLRTRFVLDWFENNGKNLPFRLFDYQQQLLHEGIFDAYNQWIFGAAQNLVAYQNWTSAHAVEYIDFSNFQKGRIFKIPAGQYYHK